MEHDDAMPVSAEDRINGAIPSPREPVEWVSVDAPSWSMPVATTPPTMSWLTTTTDPALADETSLTSDSVEPQPDPVDVAQSPIAESPPTYAPTDPVEPPAYASAELAAYAPVVSAELAADAPVGPPSYAPVEPTAYAPVEPSQPFEAQPFPAPASPAPAVPAEPPPAAYAQPAPSQPFEAQHSSAPAFPAPAYEAPGYAPTGYAPTGPAPTAYAPTGPAPTAYAPTAPAPTGYAPAAYPQPGYSQPAYAPPPVNQPQSAPAYGASPSLYPATAYPAAPAPSPWPGAPVAAAPKERTPGRGRRALLGTVLALLLVLAGGQAYVLKRTNERLDAANRARASADAVAANQISTLTSRATQLENQLKAQLNPVTVAAKIAPSVWEIDVGDFLGTAWAVRKSPGGGTDLVTNYHVVESTYKNGGRSVDLVRDKQRMHATIVKAVKANDVALVHVSQDLPVLTVATSAVVAGEAVLAEGTPLGWQSSVSTGIVSNVSRRVHTPNGTITYFQFDAGINPGNSGGPVVDADGDVVGIASAVFIDTENDVPAQSMSLAIPITTACQVLAAC